MEKSSTGGILVNFIVFVLLNCLSITMSVFLYFLSVASLVSPNEEVALIFEKVKTAVRNVELWGLVGYTQIHP